MSATAGLMPGVMQAGATVAERYQVAGESFSLAQQSQQWAVSVQSGTVADYLRSNPGMSNWVVDRTLDSRTAILRSTGAVGQSLDFTRAAQNVAWSSPVYQTAAGRWMVPTNEVVVSLRPNQRAANFFAQDARFTGYRPLPGSSDQFIATVAGGAGGASLRVANELAADARLQWVTPNFWQEFQRYATTNDPEFSRQWHLENNGIAGGRVDADVDATAAWDLERGNRSTIISVVDDGMDLSHPDLAPNLFVNTGEIRGNGIDDDNNGWVDDVNGWDFTTNGTLGDNNPGADSVNDAHATSVAGVAAGRGNNGIGISGIAQEARILPVRIFGSNGSSTTSANIASAVYYAAGRTRDGQRQWANVQIMNNSWGGGSPDAAITAAFTWASQSARGGLGTATFIAAGNGGGAALSYPASLAQSLAGVIAVGASTNMDVRSGYSQYGTGLSLVAPSNGGTAGIVTTDRVGSAGYNWSGRWSGPGSNDYTDSFGGTSSATPLTAGIGALVLSRAEDLGVRLTAAQVRGLLMNTTELIGPAATVYNDTTGWNNEYGAGRVNAFLAVSGVGQREVGVFAGRTAVASGGTVDLGGSPVGTAVSRQIRIRNEGTSPLALSGLTISGSSAFSLPAGLGRGTLAVGESTTFTVRYNPTTAGAQTASVVFTTDDANEARYTINLTGTGQAAAGDQYESDDTAATARTITTDGVAQTHSFHVGTDVDWVRFTLTQRSNVTIQTSGDAGGDTLLDLYGPNSSTTLVETDDDDGVDLYSQIVRNGTSALAAGTYYVRVSEYGQNNTLSRYTLSVLATPAGDEYESDDTAATARTITTDGVAQTHSFHVGTDVDWVTFTLAATSHVTIATDGDVGGDTILNLYGPNSSTTLVESDDDDGVGLYSQIVRTGTNSLPAGTYYVRVSEYLQNNTLSRYTLSVLATDVYEDDNVASRAATIATNGTVQNRSFHTGGDVDWVRFTLPQSRTVTIETDGIAGGDTVMELFAGDATTRITSDDDSGNGLYSRIQRTLAAGTYFIRLTEYGQNNSLALYTLRVRLG